MGRENIFTVDSEQLLPGKWGIDVGIGVTSRGDGTLPQAQR
jgi:hypothetical protein